ncbi:MAG: hypothetical protein B7Y25_02650 [Alphaproteobacteria bacterium 16-39-46]|nr:MAG: hypothetical protein B7Y25_02650 [Alphaproteobacteria bacterium 16-39-46]OZA42646.1 MAG: hypothetical protein B7X84_05420 [Alphaproteobacteria bacterium 17-39-52]HQS83827.1 hypothetical protein [Alphaproteobacteria bacterium]HQS93675.1 hypothetical protein [Alphaproteobacteria bacterium]
MLSKSAHPKTSRKDAIEALQMVVCRGVDHQKTKACNLLEGLLADEACDFKGRITILLTIAYNGLQDKKEKACATLLQLSEDEKVAPEKRLEILKAIASQGRIDQRELACRALLVFSKSKTMNLDKCFELLETVTRQGTVAQREEVSSLLWEFYNHEVKFQERLEILKFGAFRKMLDTEMKFVSALGDLVGTSTDASSLKERCETMGEIFRQGPDSYRERAAVILLSLLGSNYKAMSLDELKRIREQFRWHGTQDQKEKVDIILLSHLESNEGLSLEERLETLHQMINSRDMNNSQEKMCDILVSLLKSHKISYKVYKEVIEELYWKLSMPLRAKLHEGLFSFLQSSQALDEEDRIDIASIIIWSENPVLKEYTRKVLLSALKKPDVLLGVCLRIGDIFERLEDQSQKEQVCDVLFSFYEKSDDQGRGSIADYVIKNGTDGQKDSMSRVLLKSHSLSLSLLQEIESNLRYHGTLAQRRTFLLRLLESPIMHLLSFENWNQWVDSFFRECDPDHLDQKKQIQEDLLIILEKPSSSLPLGFRRDAAFKIIHNSRDGTVYIRRAYGVLDSILELPDFSLNDRKNLLKDFCRWHVVGESRGLAYSRLLALVENTSTDPSDRREIAEFLLDLHGGAARQESQRKSAASYLLDLLKNSSTPPLEGRKIAQFLVNILTFETEIAQKESAGVFLVSLMENSETLSSDRLDSALFLLGDDWRRGGLPDQKNRACAFLLPRIEDPQSQFSDEERLKVAQEIVKKGTPEQKERAGALLLREDFTPESKNWYPYRSRLQDLLQNGSDAQKEEAGKKLLSIPQNSNFSSELQRAALNTVAQFGTEKQIEAACDVMRSRAETKGVSFGNQLVFLTDVFKHGLPLQKEEAGVRLLSIARDHPEAFSSISGRINLIQEILRNGTPSQKKEAAALWIILLQDESLWASFKERCDAVKHFTYSAGNIPEKKQGISLLIALACEPLWTSLLLKDRLEMINRIFYDGGTQAQLIAAYSILLTISQDAALSLEDRVPQATKVLWKGNEAQKQMAFEVLKAFDTSETSLEDRLKIAESLMSCDGYHDSAPQHQAEYACSIFLSVLRDSHSTLSSTERLKIAGRVVSNGSPEQKMEGISFTLSIIRGFTRDIALQDQTRPLVRALVYGVPKDQTQASHHLESIFKNPALSLQDFNEIVRDLRWSSRKGDFETYPQVVKMQLRLLDAVQNFENGFSFEKRLAAVSEMTEISSGSNYSGQIDLQKSAYDALLTVLERPEAPLKKRLDVSKRLLSFYDRGKTDLIGSRARRILWSVLVHSETSLADRRDSAVFLTRDCKSSEMPAGAGDILFSLMTDPEIVSVSRDFWYDSEGKSKEEVERARVLSAQKDIALFLIQQGESEDQKERVGDFLNTVFLVSETLNSDDVFSWGGGRKIAFDLLQHATPSQKERAGLYLLDLISKEHLSLANRIDTAVILINDCLPSQREAAADVLLSLLTPETVAQIKNHIWQDQGIFIENTRIREESLSPMTKDTLWSVLLSYVTDSGKFSAQAQGQIIQAVLNFDTASTNLRLRARIIMAGAPKDLRSFMEGALFEREAEFSSLPNAAQQECIRALAVHPKEVWPEIIETTLTRKKIEALRKIISEGRADQREKACDDFLSFAENPRFLLETRMNLLISSIEDRGFSTAQKARASASLLDISEEVQTPSSICIRIVQTVLQGRDPSLKEHAYSVLLKKLPEMIPAERQVATTMLLASGDSRLKLRALMVLSEVSTEHWSGIGAALESHASQLEEVPIAKITALIQRLASESQDTWENTIQDTVIETMKNFISRGSQQERKYACTRLLSVAQNSEFSDEKRLNFADVLLHPLVDRIYRNEASTVILSLIGKGCVPPLACVHFAKRIIDSEVHSQSEAACGFILDNISQMPLDQQSEAAGCVVRMGTFSQRVIALMMLPPLSDIEPGQHESLRKFLFSKVSELKEIPNERMIALIQRLDSESQDTWENTIQDTSIASMKGLILRGTAQERQNACQTLLSVAQNSEISSDTRLNFADALLDEHILQPYKNDGCTVVLSLIRNVRISALMRVNFAKRVIDSGGPSQSEAACALILGSISQIPRDEQTDAAERVVRVGTFSQRVTALMVLPPLNDIDLRQKESLQHLLSSKAGELRDLSPEKISSLIQTLRDQPQEMLEKMLEPILTEEILKRFGEGPENEKELVRSFLLSLAENPHTSLEVRRKLAPNLIGGRSTEDHKVRSCQVLLRLVRASEISPEICLDLAKIVAGNGVGDQKEQACVYILDQIQSMEHQRRQNAANIVFGFGSPPQRITASMILAGVDMSRETWHAIEERLFRSADEFKEVSDTKMTTLIKSLVRHSQETWERIIQKALKWEPSVGVYRNAGIIVSRLLTSNGQAQAQPSAANLIRGVQNQLRDLTEEQIKIILKKMGVLQNDSEFVKIAGELYSKLRKDLKHFPTEDEMRAALKNSFPELPEDEITAILDELGLFDD